MDHTFIWSLGTLLWTNPVKMADQAPHLTGSKAESHGYRGSKEIRSRRVDTHWSSHEICFSHVKHLLGVAGVGDLHAWLLALPQIS